MTIRWTEYLRRRVKHEEVNIPWWVNNKTTLNEFCLKNGFPVPKIFSIWEDPNDISLHRLPESFVLKPNLMSSSQGVMVLRSLGDDRFYDSLSEKEFSMSEIVEIQNAVAAKSQFKTSYRVFAEELVLDAKDPTIIPLDYKVYCFYDKPIMVQQIDRNVNPTATFFFDGDFSPLDLDSSIASNWKHYRLGEPRVPNTFEEILQTASELTKAINTPFMRVDFYNSTRGPLVGELTPAPGGPYHGVLYKFTEEYDLKLGQEWESALARIQGDSQEKI